MAGLSWVALVGQFDVDPIRTGGELGDLRQFLLRKPPEPVSDFGSTASDHDVHEESSCSWN
jgi:hypothetical protein